MYKKLICIIVSTFVFSLNFLFCQTYIGQRQVINFDKHQYNAGTQNWKIKEDREGRLYFANNEGVLTFDGTYWQLYPLPNKTIVRSIEFGADNRLYVGGQDEIGYFSSDETGKLSFTSLKTLISEADSKFSDIWEIIRFGKQIYFRSSTKIFVYEEGKMKVFSSNWLFLGIHNGNIIAQDKMRGILTYQNQHWIPYVPVEKIQQNMLITSIVSMGRDSSLVTTVRNGLFVLNQNNLIPFSLKGMDIDPLQFFTSCIKIGNGDYLLSTYNHGFYQIDRSGKVTEHFSKAEGLQNSTIRSMYMDNNHNIWLGLDNGIDFVAYTNAIKKINPTIFNDGGGYSMTLFNNNLFFGLSTGIYKLAIGKKTDLSYSENNFIPISNGQCWNLSVTDRVIASKEDGVYELNGNKFTAFDKSTGYWNFQKLALNNIYVAGNYNGLRLFKYDGRGYSDNGLIKSLRESSRYVVVDSNNIIWVSHPYRGIYRINVADSSVKIYTGANGLPSSLNNHVFKLRNVPVIATEKGVYEFNSRTDRFAPSNYYKSIFGDISLRYLKDDAAGNIWFVQDKNMGVVDFSTGKGQITYFPELKGKILSGFENVYPIDEQNIFIGGEQGFFHINYLNYKQHIPQLNVYIRKVRAISKTDSILFGGYLMNKDSVVSKGKVPKLGYSWNSIHIEYSSPLYEKESSVEYSYNLEGFDKSWSDWSKKTEKDYTNLPAGVYTFRVKARNHINNESKQSVYVFEILPPWYKSNLAIILYVLLSSCFLYLFYKAQEQKHFKKQQIELLTARKRHEEEQSRTAYQHQLELERSEKELIKLKNEKLESEIEFKNSELASAAMNLVQKKEFLLKIKSELEHFNKSGKDSVDMSELKKILRTLSEEKKLNEEWEQFSVHFNKVQGDFLTILQEKYPDLKPHELKLCAYLRMNLSSKEIAQLMSISVRGVEISRYRLRKKLQIPTEINLFQFLFDLQRDGMS